MAVGCFTGLGTTQMGLRQSFEEQFQYPLIIAFVLLLLTLIVCKYGAVGKGKPMNLPPSPPKLPVIGNLHQLGTMPHLSLHRLAQKLGPIIYLKLGQVPTVVVSSARTAKEVLRTHDLALSNRPQIFSAKHLFYGCTDVVFAPYGDYWRNIRKICIQELLSAKRVQSYSFIREQKVASLVNWVMESSSSSSSSSSPGNTNITKLLGLYANDVLCMAAFGRDFSGGDYDRHGFQKMLEDYQVLLGGFDVGDFFPSMEFINTFTGFRSKLQNTFHRFDRFFDEVIEEHLNPTKRKGEHKDLLDVLLEFQKNDTESDMPLTMDNVKAIVLDMFAAGTDTTFITLDWAMTELITHPEVLKRAQAEVRCAVGKRRVVLESDIIQLHYMKAIIKEVFRLHPPVPVLVPRESTEDITIDGYDIPARTRFFVNAWAVGRDKESWENPDEFKPERFMGCSTDFKGKDFELIPFGAGRRGCPAITFATATVELALAQLLHSFDWELPADIQVQDLDMTELFGISMHKTAELIVVAKPWFI